MYGGCGPKDKNIPQFNRATQLKKITAQHFKPIAVYGPAQI